MDELIDKLVANVGIDRAAAQKAMGVRPGYLTSGGSSDKARKIFEEIPGVHGAVQSARTMEIDVGCLTARGQLFN
jgi:hypothetical protein